MPSRQEEVSKETDHYREPQVHRNLGRVNYDALRCRIIENLTKFTAFFRKCTSVFTHIIRKFFSRRCLCFYQAKRVVCKFSLQTTSLHLEKVKARCGFYDFEGTCNICSVVISVRVLFHIFLFEFCIDFKLSSHWSLSDASNGIRLHVE